MRYITEYFMQNNGLYGAGSIGIESALGTNKVLKNTYLLLGMTLLFSAFTAGVSMAVGLGQGTALILTLVGFGLLFVVHKTADSSNGLFAIFAFTGVMGASLGPMLNYYLAMPSGPALVMQALGATAVVFFGLSAYALSTRKDFSYMGGFLMVGLLVAVLAMIANIFLHIPALSLSISAAVVLIMSGLILFDTSRIINGGETNYIRATVSLYLNIYNLFIHLLHLLTAVTGDD
jgi:modulator of FtsH protease